MDVVEKKPAHEVVLGLIEERIKETESVIDKLIQGEVSEKAVPFIMEGFRNILQNLSQVLFGMFIPNEHLQGVLDCLGKIKKQYDDEDQMKFLDELIEDMRVRLANIPKDALASPNDPRPDNSNPK